jgi:uroporphyrinogen decarboxylase
MHRNMRSWAESVRASKKRLAIPIMTHPGIDLTGHTVNETVHNARLHAEAVGAVARAYPTAASTMIMDLSVEAEAFGAAIRFSEHEVPAVTGRRVSDADSIERLPIPDLSQARLAQWADAARQAASTISDRPLLAGCIGPFSLAARLYDVSEIMTAILMDPEYIMLLVDKCTQFLVTYVQAFKAAGANGIVMAEPVAGVLSPEHCAMFSSDYIRRIVRSTQDETFMVVLHNCGDTDTLVPSMLSTGAAALHFGNRCTITAALAQIPNETLVLGNLDPVGVFRSGTPESIRRETDDLLRSTRQFTNFVISSGCDVPPNVPLKNIDAFFDALESFNRSSSA